MSLIQAYNSFDELKNKDMSESLSTLLINAINSNLDSYQNSLSKSNDGKSQGVKETLDETISNLKTRLKTSKERTLNSQKRLENSSNFMKIYKLECQIFQKLRLLLQMHWLKQTPICHL